MPDEKKQQVYKALKKFPTKFDLKTVNKWIKQVEMVERDQEVISFRQVMKETEDRIQHAKVERLKELTNAFIEANGGQFKLHPGFDKICGLKGSKLSGGQK
jgi:hypothetical protein